jgi:hypothetical protein
MRHPDVKQIPRSADFARDDKFFVWEDEKKAPQDPPSQIEGGAPRIRL